MNWLRKLFVKDFPEPPAHNLDVDSFFRFYHKKLNERWKKECKILVYRMDPAKAPFRSLMTLDRLPDQQDTLVYAIELGEEYGDGSTSLMPNKEWWSHSDMPEPWTAVFCVRLQRTWKSEYGTKTKEICIATFEVEP